MITAQARYAICIFTLFLLGMASPLTVRAQGADEQSPPPEPAEVQEKADKPPAGGLVEGAPAYVEDLAEKVDESKQAQEASAGILKPIYSLAEYLSFPAVHWVAFAVMVTGVVSFALQLVLAKLVVLAKFGFSFTSILSDALGLTISVVGLVLTTQAAAENSNFTHSPAAVLSAAVVGIIVGFVFYWWGQAEEVQAVAGRKQQAAKEKAQ